MAHSGATEVIKGSKVLLSTPKGATAEINLLGAQVISWRNKKGEELLFNKVSKTTRGGIVICFPQFGNSGASEQHGFASNIMWSIDENPQMDLPSNDSSPKSFVDLLLKSEEVANYWPHSFEFRLRVSLTTDGELNMISRVRNTDDNPFSFSFSYHTCLLASDIRKMRITGLKTLEYLDNLSNREQFTERGDAVTFESEVDRVYLSSPNTIAVIDHDKMKGTYVIKKEGLPDFAVWNPWEQKSKEYKHMLCADSAAIENPVHLMPGQEWTGKINIKVNPRKLLDKTLECIICKVTVPSEKNLATHLKGKRHRINAAKKSLVRCEICNAMVVCDLMKKHIKTSWHMARREMDREEATNSCAINFL